MCSKATSLSFNRPKQTFGLSSKCPESHEIKSMPGQRNLLFLWWPTVFRPFLGHPFAAEKKEAMWGQKVSTATATTNGLPKIRLIWRIYLSDWTSRPLSLWGGNRQRGQMWHTLTHWTATHQVLRGRQIKGWEELSDTLKQTPQVPFKFRKAICHSQTQPFGNVFSQLD